MLKYRVVDDSNLTSGGHLYPGNSGNPGKTVFPQDWSTDKVVHAVGDIATAPDTQWFAQTGTGVYTPVKGNLLTGCPMKLGIA